MRKQFLKAITTIAAMLFVTAASAKTDFNTTYVSQVVPVPEYLQAPSANGDDTVIVTINYTDTTVIVHAPDHGVVKEYVLTRHTALRTENPGYIGKTYIDIQTEAHQPIWSNFVGHNAMIGIHLSNGKYIVYDTE